MSTSCGLPTKDILYNRSARGPDIYLDF
jgi:hypothetical protein